eukprot:TRINITY_DN1012_c0_g1_i7.p1 TRINITY_DN1012_c0_g1~~TRINITY_DN1012_c0_g1_i7.p1  ORF type:complete len:413 (+),score=107.08 TRINITY_DN1012_c0_g1_i7:1417-2655(+)
MREGRLTTENVWRGRHSPLVTTTEHTPSSFFFFLLLSSFSHFVIFALQLIVPAMIVIVNDLEIEVQPTDTVWTLKLLFYSAAQRKHHWAPIPPDHQRLSLGNGEVLTNYEKPLDSFDIHEGTHISCDYEAFSGDVDFRRFVEVIRKEERTCLKLRKITQIIGAKNICSHVHEIEQIRLRPSGGDEGRRKLRDFELLGGMLENISSLKKLLLAYNRNVGDEGIIHIIAGLEKNASIRVLCLWNCGMGVEGAKRIGKMLERNTSLKKLCLWWNPMGDEGVVRIAEGLEVNASLKKLHLIDCGMTSAGARKLGEMFERNASLVTFKLSNDEIGDEGVIRIAEGLEANTSVKKLGLAACGIQEEGGKKIGEMLERNASLVKLDLTGNEDIGDKGFKRIVNGLKKNTSLKECVIDGA